MRPAQDSHQIKGPANAASDPDHSLSTSRSSIGSRSRAFRNSKSVRGSACPRGTGSRCWLNAMVAFGLTSAGGLFAAEFSSTADAPCEFMMIRRPCETVIPSEAAQLPCVQSRWHEPIGLPGGDRTPDNLLRRQVLYPTELRAAGTLTMVGAIGFEPTTLWSQTRCATRLRYAPKPRILRGSRALLTLAAQLTPASSRIGPSCRCQITSTPRPRPRRWAG